VLINGGGGGVGTLAIQLAKLEGAEVTGVDSGVKLDGMRAVGADHVLDYAETDFTETGNRYDRILDVVANRPLTRFARALAPGGRLAVVGGTPGTLLRVFALGPLLGLATGKSLRLVIHKPQLVELERLGALCAAGQLRPIIDSSFPLERIQEAFARFATSQAVGKIVVTVDQTLA
jgi:NADPH:quinone reductase-like Zn-dependent oxidoreductase